MSEPEQMRAQSSGALDPTVVPPSKIESPTNASMGPQERTNSGEAKPVGATVTGLDVGSQLGPYLLLDKLGEGGMGAVFKARHTKLDRLVALKVLRPQLLSRPDSLSRFEREMKAVGKVHHPNVVQALDAGDFGGVHYLSMEYVEGQDLQALVKDTGPMSVINACEVIRQAAVGLAVAHESGLVHRDIKPSNLFVVKQTGQVKILDMGLALLSLEEASAALTSTGQCFGTPDYMAPEQWEDAHTCDARADLYSLGCTLYFLLAGRPPYSSDTHRSAANKMKGHMIDPAPDLRKVRQDVPDGVVAIYDQLMAKSPDSRFPSAEKLADALAAFSSSTSAPKPPAVHADLQTVTGSWQPRSAIDSPGRKQRPNWLLAPSGAVALSLLGIVVFVMTNRESPKANFESMNTTKADNKTAPSPVSLPADQSTKAVAEPPVNDPIGEPWIQLFNGRDLTGWTAFNRQKLGPWVPNGKAGWHVADGLLTNEGNDHDYHCLCTDQDDFENFHLCVEFRMTSSGNSGVWLMDPARGTTWLKTLNIQISNEAINSTGCLVNGPILPRQYRSVGDGQFHQLEVFADGDNCTTILDGEVLVDAWSPRGEIRSGRIVLEDHLDSKNEFRKVNVRRLAPGRRQPWFENSIGMRLAYIPAGKVTRDAGLSVEVPAPFLMGTHEVTATEYGKIMRIRIPNGTRSDRDRLPMVMISSHDAEKFCRTLSELPAEMAAGRRYRLPTVGEWEYAYSCGESHRFFWGDGPEIGIQYGWWAENSGGVLHTVGQLWPNPWGLYDMHGNASEWVTGGTRAGTRVEGNPIGGSFWDATPKDPMEVASDWWQNGYPNVGFRVLCESPEAIGFATDLTMGKRPERLTAEWIIEAGGWFFGGGVNGTHVKAHTLTSIDDRFLVITQVVLANLKSITDSDLRNLRRSPNIESIDLSNTAITDAALYELRMFPRLHLVNVLGTQVTDDAIKAFHKDRPNCEIVRQAPP